MGWSQWQAKDVYICLIPLTNIEALAAIENQKYNLDKAGATKWPRLSASINHTESLINKEIIPTYSSVVLNAKQSLYNQSNLNSQKIESINLELTKNMSLQKQMEFIDLQLSYIFEYYKIKEQVRIIQNKIQRKINLLDLLKDLVNSKSTDGFLLNITEGDLKLLTIRKKELELALVEREKKIYISEKLKNFIVDGKFLSWAKKVSDSRLLPKTTARIELNELDMKKNILQVSQLSGLNLFRPALDLNFTYEYRPDKNENLGVADSFTVNLAFSFSLDEFYVKKSKNEYISKDLAFLNSKVEFAKFTNTADESISNDKLKHIENSIRELESIKSTITKAKDVVEKRFIIGKASYSDYIQVDDKIDDIENEVFDKGIEKVRMFLKADMKNALSAELNSAIQCNI